MIDGITKSVKFDENGLRSEFEAQIFRLDTQGLVPTGSWSTENGITRLLDNSAPTEDVSAISLKNRTFIVLTSLVHGDFISLVLALFQAFNCILLSDTSIWNASRLFNATDRK